jgi:cyclopropane fatty-acyl-phospholipid synthase-like methyltransferase
MGWKGTAARLVNRLLAPVGAQFVPHSRNGRPWDAHFAEWIAEARASGKDPNDIGDVEWSDDPLREALERHYLPHVQADSVVLELGPGSGRLTRHVIRRCREMILVDYSPMVCAWLREYLAGKGRFTVHLIDKPALPMVPSEMVDTVLANGVFEHIGMDDLICFLEEFHRVLRRGGKCAFNFDNLMNEEGRQWHRKHRGNPGTQNIFRFYHPEMVAKLAQDAGFRTLHLAADSSRFAYIELEKP